MINVDNWKELPHFRLYYYDVGKLKKVPKFMRFKYKTEDEAVEDIELYWKLRKNHENFIKFGIKQFVLIFWYANYQDKIIKIIEQ